MASTKDQLPFGGGAKASGGHDFIENPTSVPAGAGPGWLHADRDQKQKAGTADDIDKESAIGDGTPAFPTSKAGGENMGADKGTGSLDSARTPFKNLKGQ